MEYSDAARRALEHLGDDDAFEAFVTGVDSRDPHALVIGAIYGRPEVARLSRLRDMDAVGASLATDLILMGIVSPPDRAFYRETWRAVAENADRFRFAGDQSDRLRALILETEELDSDQRAELVGWLHRHDAAVGLIVARELVDEHSPQASDAVELRAFEIVGATGETEDHERLHVLASRLVEANQIAHVPPVFGAIATPGPDDLDVIGDYVQAIGASAAALPPSVAGLLGRLDAATFVQLFERFVAAPNLHAWGSAHLLPGVVDVHLPALIEATSESWWPEWGNVWLTNQIVWAEHPDGYLLSAITQLQASAPNYADTLRSSLQAIITATPDQTQLSRHPRLGAAFLFNEALAGDIAESHGALVAALKHLEPEHRIGVYHKANWRKKERAHVAVATIRAVGAEDLANTDIQVKISDLAPGVLMSVLDEVARETPAHGTVNLVELLIHDADALSVLAAHSGARAVLFERWDTENNLDAFRALLGALESATPETDPLTLVEAKVRDYSNRLSAVERVFVAAQLPDSEQSKLLSSILDDRHNPTSNAPADELLIAAVRELGLFEDASMVFEVLGQLGESYPAPEIRSAVVLTLGEQEPTAEIANYLQARERDEVAKVRPAATAALDQIANRLDEIAGTDNRHVADPALAVLADVRPERALPHAQQRLSSPDPETRQTAAIVLGAHGDASIHTADLERAVEHEPTKVTREAIEGAIRRLKVGDVIAAHEYLGELTDLAGPGWDSMDTADLYDEAAPLIVAGLDRVVSNRSSGHWGTAIDQLSEVAKYLLFRVIAVAGPGVGLKQALVGQAAANSIDYGSVLNNAQIYATWSWIASLNSLYQLRTEHLSKKNDMRPVKEATSDDFTSALVMFRQGAGQCLTVLRQAI